ncbi:MAG: ankyrin repeat domain-containing protein [Nitrospinota bacterium]|nr:ankyrin repeat domain-containing protein [Nitrospinota bacterium]
MHRRIWFSFWIILSIQLLPSVSAGEGEVEKNIKIGIQYISEAGKIVFSVSNTGEKPVDIFNYDLGLYHRLFTPLGFCAKLKAEKNKILHECIASVSRCSILTLPVKPITLNPHETIQREMGLNNLFWKHNDFKFSPVKYIKFRYTVYLDGYLKTKIDYATEWLPFDPPSVSSKGTEAIKTSSVNESLFEAVKNKDEKALRDLLVGGVDPNSIFMNGESLLHRAANKYAGIMGLLLDQGVNPNIKNEWGETPLHEVSKISELSNQGDPIPKMMLLLDRGADPNARKKNGQTPLFDAVTGKDKDAIRMLLKRGADPNIQDRLGETPLHYAARESYVENFRILLDHGADLNIKNRDGDTPLLLAAVRGNPDMVKLLLSWDTDSKFRKLNSGIDLLHEVRYGKVERIHQLLAQGVNPNSKDLDRRSWDLFGESPLFASVARKDKTIFNKLLARGGDLNALSGNGETVLFWAARWGGLGVFKLLLTKGVDPKIKNNSGDTLLHWAASGGNFEIVKMLLIQGADPNALNKAGESPLFFASRERHHSKPRTKEFIKTVKILLGKDADPNITNFVGDTPLHTAVKWKHKEIVRMLLEKGANPNAINKDGETPLSWTGKNQEIEDLLKSYGAKPWG